MSGTGVLAPLYLCSRCGRVDGREEEDIDTENDEIYPYTACAKCGAWVQPLLVDGVQVYREVDEEELFWESFDGGCDEE